MGHLHGVTIDIGVRVVADFEVIEIINDSNPYWTLLEIDWKFDINLIIKLNKGRMLFGKNELQVIVSMDPVEGAWYT